VTIHAFGRALGQPPGSVLPKSLLGLCWWLASQTNRTSTHHALEPKRFLWKRQAARITQHAAPFFLERTLTAAWPRRVVAPINALRCAAELESDALHGLAGSGAVAGAFHVRIRRRCRGPGRLSLAGSPRSPRLYALVAVIDLHRC
jgi:hypothetical protein